MELFSWDATEYTRSDEIYFTIGSYGKKLVYWDDSS